MSSPCYVPLANSTISNIINTILYAVGIAAVVMIIVGGIRYAISAGNEKGVTRAKNTLIDLATAIHTCLCHCRICVCEFKLG